MKTLSELFVLFHEAYQADELRNADAIGLQMLARLRADAARLGADAVAADSPTPGNSWYPEIVVGEFSATLRFADHGRISRNHFCPDGCILVGDDQATCERQIAATIAAAREAAL